VNLDCTGSPRGGSSPSPTTLRPTDDNTCAIIDNDCATVDDSPAPGSGDCVLHDNNVDLPLLLTHKDIHLVQHLAHHTYPLTYLLPDHHRHQRLRPSYRLRGRLVELPIAP